MLLTKILNIFIAMFQKRMISVESAKKPIQFNWPVGPVNVLILLIRPPKNFTGPLHSKIRYISSVGDFFSGFSRHRILSVLQFLEGCHCSPLVVFQLVVCKMFAHFTY